MNPEVTEYLQENDAKTLARIDEILARSRKVVEESMELSKKTIENKLRIIETPSSEVSIIIPKESLKVLETSSEKDSKYLQQTEKSLDELNQKIKNLQSKAVLDEHKIEILKGRILSEKQKNSTPEIAEADKLLETLKETLAVGLSEENKRLKSELESQLKKKSSEEMRLSKELEEIIKERKTLENQLKNLKYLFESSPNYTEELNDAKLALERLEQQSIDTIKLLEIRIQEQENDNFRLKEALKNPNPENLNIDHFREKG
jgi:chromosome segregation ATPase